jgi:acetyltransferase-like isoleucine patch superfamily enzyme
MMGRFWNQRIRGIPGALYEMTAAACYSLRDRVSTVVRRGNLARAGPGVFIQAGAVIRNPERVSLGRGVRIGRDVVFTTERGDGSVSIGDETWFDKGCHVDFTGDLVIGSGCTFSANVRIYSHDHGRDPRSPPNPRRLRIGDRVWVGTGASILQNVGELGDGCVIAAGAVVTKRVPPEMLVGGNPARVVGPIDARERIEKIVQS